MDQPDEGSVVLTDGERGTAWQRWVSDGRWHSTTGQVADWADLVARSNGRQQRLILIHRVTRD